RPRQSRNHPIPNPCIGAERIDEHDDRRPRGTGNAKMQQHAIDAGKVHGASLSAAGSWRDLNLSALSSPPGLSRWSMPQQEWIAGTSPAMTTVDGSRSLELTTLTLRVRRAKPQVK